MTRFIIQLYIFSFDSECTIIPLPFPSILSLIGGESITMISFFITWNYQHKKIYKWKNEICTLLNYSVILPNFASYRFFSLFLVGDQHCRLLQTYYEVNCCCIISYTPHTCHNAWQYHGSYKNSAGSLLCYLVMLSKSICSSFTKLLPFT